MPNSLAWALLAAAVAVAVTTPLWVILDAPAGELRDQPSWNNNSSTSGNASDVAGWTAQGQRWIGDVWDFLPAIAAVAAAFSVLVRSRPGVP